MRTITSVEHIHDFKESSYSTLVSLGTWGTVTTALLTQSSAVVTTAVGLSVLKAADWATSLAQMESLLGYLSVKVLSAAAFSAITATALLSLASLPVTVTSVALLSGWIAVPTAAELLVELFVAYYHSLPNEDQKLCKEAEGYLGHRSQNPFKGIAILKNGASKGYPECMALLARCYREGRGVPKDAQQATLWSLKSNIFARLSGPEQRQLTFDLQNFLRFFTEDHQVISALRLLRRAPLSEVPIILKSIRDYSHTPRPIETLRRHFDENHRPVTVHPPALPVHGKRVAFCPKGFASSRKELTFADLPIGIKNRDLNTLLAKAERRLESHSNPGQVKKVIHASFSSEALHPTEPGVITGIQTVGTLVRNLRDNSFITSLMNETSDPEEVVSKHKYMLYCIIDFIKSLPNKPTKGDLLSPREQALFSLSASVQDCNQGRMAGIALFYSNIPDKFKRIQSSSVGGEDAVRTFVAQQAQAFLEAQFTSATSTCNPHIEATASNPFMKEATGCDRMPELAHITRFLKNLIGNRVGLDTQVEYDENSHVIPPRLYTLGTDQALEIFYRHVTPQQFVIWMTEAINRAIKSDSGHHTKKSFYNGVPTILGRGPLPWDQRTQMLKETAARRLLVKMNFLVER